MFRESYTKFYTIIVAALALGFVGMEMNSWFSGDNQLTGMATAAETGHIIGIGGGEIAFLAIGLVVGAAIIGAVHQAYRLD